jgi:transcriptional regulator with XRE-family HTH domain
MIDKYNIMADLYEYSTPELVRLLGSRFKEYRMRCNFTQKEVADQSGIGLTTIHKFENGSAGNLSLSTFILLLKVVGQINALDDLLPELPESPYLMRGDEKKAQRIRH